LNAATRFKSFTANVRLTEGPPQIADVSFKAIDVASRPDQVDARITYSPDDLRVSLATLLLTTSAGAWRLQRSAEFRMQHRAMQIQAFDFISGSQSITIDGTASVTGAQNLRARLNRISLAALMAL